MSMLLGLDLGTQGAKGLLIDGSGRIKASNFAPFSMVTPHPGWAEQDPQDWWRALVQVIRGIISESGEDPSAIAAIGLSGHMHGPALIDESGAPLCPCVLWLDTRSEKESDFILKTMGQDIVRITGNPVISAYTAPKLLWIKKNWHSTFERINKVLFSKDYVRLHLTGDVATDYSDASGSLLFDIQKRCWSHDILDTLGIPYEYMPDIKESLNIAGRVSDRAAAETGLAAGTPVVVGAGDLACGLIGSGAIDTGVVSLIIGTAGQIMAVSDVPSEEGFGKVYHFCHAVPDKYFVLGALLSGGICLRWFRDVLGVGEKLVSEFAGLDAYDLLSKEASQARPGSEGLIFMPYLAGTGTPYLDSRARGGFIGLTLRHGRPEMVRSIMEGIAYGLRDSIQLFRDVGFSISQVRVAGGGIKSRLWRQILAEVFASPVIPLETVDASPLGAALLAGVGIGMYRSLDEASQAVVRVGEPLDPIPRNVEVYESCYNIYTSLYSALRDSFARWPSPS
ncbi:MAG: xylulokinase [Firmicutes bacterium]|nr:xylulokinase [Bacillota bacterium]